MHTNKTKSKNYMLLNFLARRDIMNDLKKIRDSLVNPSPELIDDFKKLDGDIMILGVGGKMGSDLAILAKNAMNQANIGYKVIGVSRFSSGNMQQDLESHGIETIAADLLDDKQLDSLPNVKNIIYMVGRKFGTMENEHLTWAMNTYLPGKVAEKFKDSKIVVFSTGNVYAQNSIKDGGASEDDPMDPIGEYAQSCLGRERVFEYISHKYKIPMLFFRLNYANDLRYGVLYEVAKAVKSGQAIDLTTGHVNIIWQRDANEYALRSLSICEYPPNILNITGPETVSVRWLAESFGKLFEVDPIFINTEGETALLNNAAKSHKLFGYPKVSLGKMIEWQAEWLNQGGEVLDKPTHFQEKKGEY